MGHGDRVKDHEKRVKTALRYKYDWFFKQGNTMKNAIVKQIVLSGKHIVWQILMDNIERHEAGSWEKLFISALGRIDLGTGILTNLTPGGEDGAYERKTSTWDEFEMIEQRRFRMRESFPVIQYCPFTETYNRFGSIRHIIGKDAPNHERIGIGNVCRGTYLQQKGYIYFWEKDFTPQNIDIRVKNFFSMNPQRLAIAKKEYRKRYMDECLNKVN